MYVRTGAIHLLNSKTGTFTPSEIAFDTIRDGIGSYLGEKFEKLFFNHDRKPGQFRENSELAPIISEYSSSGITFENVAYEIGERLFKMKVEHEVFEESILIILSAKIGVNDYLMGAEIQRQVGYLISSESNEGKGQNAVKADNLIIPPISAKKARFFTINERTMEVSTREEIVKDELYLIGEALLQADMGHSINWYVDDARKAYYSALKGHLITDGNPISFRSLETEKEIKAVNYLEDKMKESIKENGCIDFYVIGKNEFFYNQERFDIFLENLEGYNVARIVQSLSNAPLKIKKLEYRPKRIRLKSGIEVIVTDEFTEFDGMIKLKEVDGDIVEVVEEEECDLEN